MDVSSYSKRKKNVKRKIYEYIYIYKFISLGSKIKHCPLFIAYSLIFLGCMKYVLGYLPIKVK